MFRRHDNRIGLAFCLLAGCLALVGCETRISTSATTNAPVQYSHVYVTIEEVWVNASATAGPDDTAWVKATLDAPQTIDMVGLTNGTLKEFATSLPVPAGTYNQLRLILRDTSASLASSAQSLSAQFNNEVDYFDEDGNVQQAPLEAPNIASGVAIPVKLDVRTSEDAILAAIGSSSSSSACSSTSTSSSSSCTDTSTTTDTSTDTASTTDTSGLGTVTATAAIVFDANRDIARFAYEDEVGFVLNAQLSAYDLANVGTIRSQLNISALTLDANTNRPDVQVTAETPSSDGTRNVPVLSAPLRADGTFILYPFLMDDDSPSTYDLVIHGPGIQTLIIKSVPVQSGTPTSASKVDLNSVAIAVAASTYPVNVAAASPLAARGARVGFYQTLNASDEIPYLIEERTVDPVSGLFAVDQTFPADDIAFATFNSGSTLTLSTGTPVEGTGAYKLAALAAVYGDSDFSGTLTAPTAGTTTTTTFTAPTVAVPSSATSGTITANVSIASPGVFDKGIVVITHDGAIVAALALDSLLVPAQASGTLTLSSIPAGASDATFDAGTYYAEAWVWKSSDAANTFVRLPATALIDLRATNAGTVALTISE